MGAALNRFMVCIQQISLKNAERNFVFAVSVGCHSNRISSRHTSNNNNNKKEVYVYIGNEYWEAQSAIIIVEYPLTPGIHETNSHDFIEWYTYRFSWASCPYSRISFQCSCKTIDLKAHTSEWERERERDSAKLPFKVFYLVCIFLMHGHTDIFNELKWE